MTKLLHPLLLSISSFAYSKNRTHRFCEFSILDPYPRIDPVEIQDQYSTPRDRDTRANSPKIGSKKFEGPQFAIIIFPKGTLDITNSSDRVTEYPSTNSLMDKLIHKCLSKCSNEIGMRSELEETSIRLEEFEIRFFTILDPIEKNNLWF